MKPPALRGAGGLFAYPGVMTFTSPRAAFAGTISELQEATIEQLIGSLSASAEFDIVLRAVSAPIKQIAANGGLDGSLVAQKVEDSSDANFGFNAATGEYEDLVKAGISVPTKVERVALQNAASVASLLLTTECAIVDVKEKKKPAAGGHDHDMDY